MSKIVLISIFTSFFIHASAQSIIKRVTLQQAIEIAKERSVRAMEAKNKLHIAHWQYRNFRADLLPNVSLKGTVPRLNRSYNRYQNADGSYKFVSNSSIEESLEVSITQNIALTGGAISFNSQINRLDGLDGDNTTNYLTSPAMVTLSQPIFSYNRLKWDMRIQPIKNVESQKQYIADLEAVCLQTVNYYFDLLLSMINKNIAEQNLKNATQLYKFAQNKKRLGLISENDLQQLRFGYTNASASIIEANQNYDGRMYELRTFLGYDDLVELVPEMPADSPALSITYDEVMAAVKSNNPFFESVGRRSIDSERQIAQAKSNRGDRKSVV